MKEKPAYIITTTRINEDPLTFNTVTFSVTNKNVTTQIATLPITNWSNFTTQTDTKPNFANFIQTKSTNVTTKAFVHLHILKMKSSKISILFIYKKRQPSFICTNIKQFGVHSLRSKITVYLVIKEINVPMLITFRIIEEIQKSIIMNRSDASFGIFPIK